MVPELRERYLRERNAKLMALLQTSQTPTEQFWAVEEEVNRTALILRACLDGHSRSRIVQTLHLMRRHEMLGDADLLNFSVPLRERVLC